MKEGKKLFFILGFVLLLSLSFVSAGFFGDIWGKMTGKAVAVDDPLESISCYVTSQCDDNNLCTLDNCVEGACEYITKLCLSGQECIPTTGECEIVYGCSDLDGENLYVRGTTTSNVVGERTDSCYNDFIVEEYLCDGEQMFDNTFNCPYNYVCELGRCLSDNPLDCSGRYDYIYKDFVGACIGQGVYSFDSSFDDSGFSNEIVRRVVAYMKEEKNYEEAIYFESISTYVSSINNNDVWKVVIFTEDAKYELFVYEGSQTVSIFTCEDSTGVWCDYDGCGVYLGSCTCSSVCSPGETKCDDGSNSVITCGNYDEDPCFEYSVPEACDSLETCVDGVCKSPILSTEIYVDDPRDSLGHGILISESYFGEDYTSYAGGYCKQMQGCTGFRDVEVVDDSVWSCRCDENYGTASSSCLNPSASLSWERVGSVVCTGCESNTLTCTDECNSEELEQCATGGESYEVCGDYDNDGCLEWGVPISLETCEDKNYDCGTFTDVCDSHSCGVCLDGNSCIGGQCVSDITQSWCYDSDSLNYYEKNLVTDSEDIEINDSCIEDYKLSEGICSDSTGLYDSVEFDCPNGCFEGACNLTVLTESTCATLSWSSCGNNEFCSNELFTDSVGAICCKNDDCVELVSPTCSETDKGIDYILKGEINWTDSFGIERVINDSCGLEVNGEYSENYLMEYYCDGNIVKHKTITCAHGCFDGACLEEGVEEKNLVANDFRIEKDGLNVAILLNYNEVGLNELDKYWTEFYNSFDNGATFHRQSFTSRGALPLNGFSVELDSDFEGVGVEEIIMRANMNSMTQQDITHNPEIANDFIEETNEQDNCIQQKFKITNIHLSPSQRDLIPIGEVETCEEEIECDSGCILNNKCYDYGYRKNGQYCYDLTDEFVNEKLDDAGCENSFECGSNFCVDGQCVEAGLFKKIINWFKIIFSRDYQP